MGFDPDKYLAKQTNRFSDPMLENASGGGFDPDAYLKKTAPKQDESWGKGLLRKGLDALPIVGGIVGGGLGAAAGAPTGPGAIATGIGGAALGTAAGESYKQLGKNYFFDEKEQPMEAAKKIATAGAEGAVSQVAGNALGKGAKALAGTKAGKAVVSKVGGGLAKVGEALTGVNKKAIETYAKRAPEIQKMSKAAGGDSQVAADTLRKQFQSSIEGTKSALNSQLEKALEKNASKQIEVSPILDELAKQQQKINPKLYPEALEQIDDVIRKVNSLAKDGKLGLKDGHEVKKYLQGLGKRAYSKNGQIFSTAPEVAKAGKGAARIARKGVNVQADDVAQANNKLSNLHSIEDTMARGLLKEGGSPAALSKANNVSSLKRLGEATGEDMVGQAENLGAMKAFGDAPILPMDFTGKSLTRMGLGMGGGYALDGQEGAMTGAALTSPLVLKGIIRSGRGLMKGGGLLLNSGAGQQMTGDAMLQINEYFRKRKAEGATDEQIQQELGQVE